MIKYNKISYLISFLTKFLAPVSLSAISGMAIQFSTSPVLLRIGGLEKFSYYIIIISISTYVGLALNGILYSLMNSVTKSAFSGKMTEAADRYSDMYSIIIQFTIVILTAASISWFFIDNILINAIFISCGVVSVKLFYICVDANYRSRDKFAVGTNILTITRIYDWILLCILYYSFESLSTIFLFILISKIIYVFFMSIYLSRVNSNLPHRFCLMGIRRLLWRIKVAYSQITISLAQAAMTVFPQLLVSAMFSANIAVTFNVTRTYMRLLILLTNVVTAGAWPLVNRWYAEGRFDLLKRYMITGLRTLSVAGLGCMALLIVLAPFAFRILYPDLAFPSYNILFLIALSVFIFSQSIFAISYFVATGANSKLLILIPAVLIVEFLSLWGLREYISFIQALSVMALTDLAVLLFSYGAARTNLMANHRAPSTVDERTEK